MAIAPESTAAEAGAPPALSMSELDLFKLESALNAIVVTTSRGDKEEKALAAASVVTISKEEIRAYGWRSLAEVLASVPGLYVIDDLVQPAVGVRGVTGGLAAGTRIVKVMIDGIAVDFRPELTAFIGPEFIPIEAVERIEIAKGPLSAVYGANAFLATVNVITKVGKTGPRGEVGIHGGVLGSGGSVGASGLLSLHRDNAWLLAAFSTDRNDRSGQSLQQSIEGIPAPSLLSRQSEGDLAQPISIYLQGGLSSARLGTLTIQGGLQRLNSKDEFGLNSLTTHLSRVALLNVWTGVRYDQQWTKASLSAYAGYSYGNADSAYSLYLTDNPRYSFHPNVDYHAGNAAVSGSYSPFGKRLSVRLGLDLEYSRQTELYYTQTFLQAEAVHQPGDQVDLLGANDDPHINGYDVGAFIHVASSPFRRLPGLHLTGDLRVDKIVIGPADFDPQYSWRAAVAYRIKPRFTVKLIAGRAFQTPSTTLLLGRPGFGNRYNVIGNLNVAGVPRLRPQVITSAELAFSAGLFRHLTLDGSVYYQDLADKIEFQQTGSDFVASNQGRSTSVGFELSAHFTYGRYTATGWGTLNLGLLAPGADGQLTAAQNPTPLFPLGAGLFSFQVDVPEAYLHLIARGRVVGPRGSSQSNTTLNNGTSYTLPTYGIIDLSLSTTGLRLLGPQLATRLLAAVRNLTDSRYSDPGFGGYDTPALGRTFFFELSQSF